MCRAVNGPVPHETDYRLREAGDQTTRVEVEITADAQGFFGVAERVVQAVTEREIATALGNLKDLLEDRRPGGVH